MAFSFSKPLPSPTLMNVLQSVVYIHSIMVPIGERCEKLMIDFKQALDLNPPLKAFVYTLAVFAGVPTALFMIYASSVVGFAFGSSFVIGGIFVIGSVGVGAFLLFWTLLGSLFMAVMTTSWFTLGYFCYLQTRTKSIK